MFSTHRATKLAGRPGDVVCTVGERELADDLSVDDHVLDERAALRCRLRIGAMTGKGSFDGMSQDPTATAAIINTGDEDMRLYVVYAPVHHTPGIVQKTSEDAEKDEESGRDKPPAWSVQPQNTEPDKKA